MIDHGTVIAEGTSDELKDQIGGEVLEVQVEELRDTGAIAETLSGIGTAAHHVDADSGTVRVPVGRDGVAALVESVRRLDGTGIKLADIALHRPTLDDVFLSLTGRGAEDMEAKPDEASEGRRGKRGRKDA